MKLDGLQVVSFESRLSKTLSDLIRVQGGEPIQAPSMREIPLENNHEAFSFAEDFFAGRVDVLILLTGVGTKALIQALETRYPTEKILEQFRKTCLVPRGPKPIRVLNELKVPFAVTVPEPNTWKELLQTLDQHAGEIPLCGKKVAVQEYGVSNPELLQRLSERGADVRRVPVYRWALPEDLAPLQNAIRQILKSRAQVAIFTTAIQIDHVLKVAGQMGVEKELKDKFKDMVIASVGPDTTQALRSAGIERDLEPESPKMGPLVSLVSQKAKMILQSKKEADCATLVRGGALDLMADQDAKESIFLKACRLEKTACTPVWLMRQAGRYMKDYRKLREEYPFMELCKRIDLAAEITVHAQQKLNADAAIIFSDILLIVEPMGFKLDYLKGGGPRIQKSMDAAKDVDKIRDFDPAKELNYVLKAISKTRASLKPEIALIGFAGAPFTLASYLIEGGSSKNFDKTKAFMKNNPEAWDLLLKKIAGFTASYLNAQAEAGADAVQLFDSWAGHLNKEEYKKFALPYSKMIFENLKPGLTGIHFGTNTAPFLEEFASAPSQVVSVDHRIDLSEAWEKIGKKKAIQGNLDPMILFKDLKTIEAETKKILRQAHGRAGHIFNLGHGVLPETPEENVIALVRMVHEFSGS